jgi:hypothetical protein
MSVMFLTRTSSSWPAFGAYAARPVPLVRYCVFSPRRLVLLQKPMCRSVRRKGVRTCTASSPRPAGASSSKVLSPHFIAR